MLRKILINTRKTVKIIILLSIAIILGVGVVALLFKPTYKVKINGEEVGYTENKSELQKQINAYIEKGDGTNDNVAFVQVEDLPQYEICLLKKDITTNDEEIVETIKNRGITYYRYYAILENDEEKAYVAKFEDAENVINQLKGKNSTNIDKLSIVEKYETELKEFTSVDELVSKLYVEPVKVVTVAKKSSGTVNTSLTTSGAKVNIGITLARPISGIITSRFGVSSSIRKSSHTGLDIAASKGTPIGAAAAGTVTFAGYKGSFGNMIVVTHDNGVQTYYCHCSELLASVGQRVAQGQTIAKVGSTGNSTGPHLHLEVRVNGIAYNPQNYVY